MFFPVFFRMGTEERSTVAPDGRTVVLQYGFVRLFCIFPFCYRPRWFVIDGSGQHAVERSHVEAMFAPGHAPGRLNVWDRVGWILGLVALFLGAIILALVLGQASGSDEPADPTTSVPPSYSLSGGVRALLLVLALGMAIAVIAFVFRSLRRESGEDQRPAAYDGDGRALAGHRSPSMGADIPEPNAPRWDTPPPFPSATPQAPPWGSPVSRPEPTPGYPPPTGPAVPVGSGARQPWWRQTRVTVAVAIVLVLGGIGIGVWGSVTETPVDQLAAGDCIDVPSTPTFEKVSDVDCTDDHDAEVVAVVPTAAGVGSGLNNCKLPADAYLRGSEGAAAYELSGIILPDTNETVCLVKNADGSKLTEPADGSGR